MSGVEQLGAGGAVVADVVGRVGRLERRRNEGRRRDGRRRGRGEAGEARMVVETGGVTPDAVARGGDDVHSGGDVGRVEGEGRDDAALGAVSAQGRPLSRRATLDREPQLFGHFGANGLSRTVSGLAGRPDELENGSSDGEGEAGEEDDEDSADVLHSEGVGLALLVLLVPRAGDAGVLPPLVVEHLDHPLVLEREDGQGDLVSPRRADRRGDAVALGVEEPPDLGEVAVALHFVLDHRRLHQEGVVALQHPRHPLLVRLDEDTRSVLHELPHFLVRLDPRVPEERHRRARLEGSVLDFGLGGEVLDVLDGRDHPLDGEKGSQIRSVRGYQNEREEPPNRADYSRRNGLWVQITSLVHQCYYREPKGVGQRKLVLDDVRVVATRVWVYPLVRREPGHYEHGGGDQDVRGEHVEPNFHGEGRHEGKQPRRHRRGQLEQNADSQIHKWLSKVDHGFPCIIYCHRSYCQVCSRSEVGPTVHSSSSWSFAAISVQSVVRQQQCDRAEDDDEC